jgi:hypothetical protein
MMSTKHKTYTSGAFTVLEQVIQDGDRTWVELELTVSSGPVRVLVRNDEQLRQAVLRAEVLALASIGQALLEARGANEEQNE